MRETHARLLALALTLVAVGLALVLAWVLNRGAEDAANSPPREMLAGAQIGKPPQLNRNFYFVNSNATIHWRGFDPPLWDAARDSSARSQRS